MKPYYEDGSCTIYHGDCRDVLPNLTADVVVTDPPYGIAIDTRFGKLGGNAEWNAQKGDYAGKDYPKVRGDEEPFDPAPLLAWPCALFGANHYSPRLPDGGTWHVWDKRDGMGSNMFADCEFLWTSYPSGPSRIFRHKWLGYHRASESKVYLHPTQKPVLLLRWILERAPAGVVLDPFMGSGPTLQAAKELGRKAIGVEIEERYCETAARRLSETLDLGAA